VTNALAYYKSWYNTSVKSFLTFAPAPNPIKLWKTVLSNKLARLIDDGHEQPSLIIKELIYSVGVRSSKLQPYLQVLHCR
jgi:hypothetical protein